MLKTFFNCVDNFSCSLDIRFGLNERPDSISCFHINIRNYTGSFFHEPTALVWEINAMKLSALMDEPDFCPPLQ